MFKLPAAKRVAPVQGWGRADGVVWGYLHWFQFDRVSLCRRHRKYIPPLTVRATDPVRPPCSICLRLYKEMRNDDGN